LKTVQDTAIGLVTMEDEEVTCDLSNCAIIPMSFNDPRPQAAADSRIRRRIFDRWKSAEKKSASRIRRQILSAENPQRKMQIFE